MNLEVMLDSLQAKIIARLLQSGRLPWEAFFLTHFDRSPQFSLFRYGACSIFLTKTTQDLGIQISIDPSFAAQEIYAPSLASVRSTAKHWASRQLTQLGRVLIA